MNWIYGYMDSKHKLLHTKVHMNFSKTYSAYKLKSVFAQIEILNTNITANIQYYNIIYV
jgi:predicted transport protein